jgi:hypothetical protein
MRIGIDAHIILPQHKRYDPKIAKYTEQLIKNLLAADKKQEHTWVLFFDERMKDTKKFAAPNVVIKQFPFIQYRTYLPVVYSHMLISAFLRSAHLDVFHSPEGLVPFMYPGKIITTFHYVPRGGTESNLFVRTFMLGARAAFAQLCRRAKRIIVSKENDKKLLIDIHGYPGDQVVVMPKQDPKELMKVYKEVDEPKVTKTTAKKSATKTKAKKK